MGGRSTEGGGGGGEDEYRGEEEGTLHVLMPRFRTLF